VVKLLDFGTSKLVLQRPTLRKLQPTTEKNVVHGTWTYMSPEQILGEPPLEHTSDLFTMAIIAYEMLSGHHPFACEDELESRQLLGYRACINEPEPITRYLPDCPEELWHLLFSMFQKNPKSRPSSAAKVGEKMREIRSDYLAKRGLTIAPLAGLLRSRDRALAPTEPAERARERAARVGSVLPLATNRRFLDGSPCVRAA
jgi:serine/threonine-protein kinase